MIALEIAHLLIGTRDHSGRGLLRGEWKADELARHRPSDWLLSRGEGLEIRRPIRRRSSGSPPALRAADPDLAPDVTPQ